MNVRIRAGGTNGLLGQSIMLRALRASTLLLAVAMAAGCSVKQTTAPPLSGPSELALSVTVQAAPDTLTQDGASQAQVIVTARDANAQPVANVTFSLEITVSGVVVDFGTLSTKSVTTDSTGRATAIYTAPAPAPGPSVDTGTVVLIQATPVGTNYASSVARSVSIRLVPPGTIVPPSNLATGFTYAPATPTEHDPVVFTAFPPCSASVTTNCTSGQVATYGWTFGDGGTASGQTATHRFAMGTYAVTLTITDSYGRTASATQAVTVAAGQAPVATFTVSPSDPIVGQAIFVNGSASTAAIDRTIVSYRWDFGDGGTATGVSASHTYTVPGTYAIVLTVTDDAGRSGSSSLTVTVSETGTNSPVASFSFSPTNATHPATIYFNGTGSTSPSGIAAYTWDFGDGNAGNGPIVSHTYVNAGAYVVRLTVTDSAGRTATATQTVTIG